MIYFRYDIPTKLLDTRQHQLMLEAARYSVLFSMPLAVNFLSIFVAMIVYIYNQSLSDFEQDWMEFVYGCLISSFLMTKEFFLSMAIQLSFIFSHSTYEKICKKCDERVEECCEAMVRRKNANKGRKDELKQSLLRRN